MKVLSFAAATILCGVGCAKVVIKVTLNDNKKTADLVQNFGLVERRVNDLAGRF